MNLHENVIFNSDFMNLIRPIRIAEQIRLGRSNDGGYVVPSIAISNTTHLISIGYGNDASFEFEFIERGAKKVFLFDDKSSIIFHIKEVFISLIGRFVKGKDFHPRKAVFDLKYFLKVLSNSKIQFKKKSLVPIAQTRKNIDFQNLFGEIPIENAAVKIDIEENEYACFSQFVIPQRITLLIIEFHEIQKNLPSFQRIIKMLKQNFCITNVHINNFGHINEGIPSTIEMVFLNKKFVEKEDSFVAAIPSNIDHPNSVRFPEIYYTY